MKKFFAVLFALLALAAGAALLGIGVGGMVEHKEELLGDVKSLTNAAASKVSGTLNGLIVLTGEGKVIEESQIRSLLGSGITGEGYEFDTDYYPYYAFLAENEKAVYRQAYANAAQYETTFLLSQNANAEEVERALDAFFYDHPELFWVETSYGYTYLVTGVCLQVTLQFNLTKDEIPAACSAFDAGADEILNAALRFGTEYEREKYVHDTLIQKTEYDAEAAFSQSAYSALVLGRSVCAGYARAFQYLMCRMGIPTYYCTGSSEGSHAWNIVKLGGEYYNVDLTWDDSDPVSYYFFNRTDADFAATHTREGASLSLPACTATQYRGLENNFGPGFFGYR